MASKQGDLRLLQEPVAQSLLVSRIPARLAYTWLDGTPRVIPIWFHWTGDEIVLGTPPTSPKMKAIPINPAVALTIDDDSFPARVLLVRGTAKTQIVDGVTSEYAAAAERYLGEQQGRSWVQQLGGMFSTMARIAIRPKWVAILDFQTRFPSAIESATRGKS